MRRLITIVYIRALGLLFAGRAINTPGLEPWRED